MAKKQMKKCSISLGNANQNYSEVSLIMENLNKLFGQPSIINQGIVSPEASCYTFTNHGAVAIQVLL